MPRRPHSGESGVATAIPGLACPRAAPSARLPRSAVLVTLRRLLTDVPLDAAIANKEIFGLVVVVEAVDTPEDVIAAANRTLYGLTSSILAGDTYKAFEVAPKVLAGLVDVKPPLSTTRSTRRWAEFATAAGAVQDRAAWTSSAM